MKDALGIKDSIPTIPEDEAQKQREKTTYVYFFSISVGNPN